VARSTEQDGGVTDILGRVGYTNREWKKKDYFKTKKEKMVKGFKNVQTF
jgi:hypothetical protein